MKATKPSICGLDEFGLSIGQLTSLGSAKVKFHAHFRHVNETPLFKLKPSQRREKTKRHYELLLSRVKKKWNYGPLDVTWTLHEPRSFSASVEARQVSHLLRMPEILVIWLDEIPGPKRVSVKSKERWFAVKARFAIQVEGRTTGLQSYEDRIVMLKATSFEEAKNKLLPEFKRYGAPYLNADGFMVRWAFECVLDDYEIGDEKIDPRGVEVFSVLAERRMKPKYVWQPKRKEQVQVK